MKKRLIFIVTAFVALTGCNIPKEQQKSQSMANSEVENFFQLMEQNQVGDEKSIYWDGTNATEVEDEFDSLELQDGRWQITGGEVITVSDMFEFTYPDTMDSVTILSDLPEDYHLCSEDLDVHIRQIEYEKEVENASKQENLKRVTDELLSEHQTEYFEQYELYLGISDTENGDYAGYTLFFKSNLADRAYCISVNGIGNMEDIKIVALYVMNHFDVLFY